MIYKQPYALLCLPPRQNFGLIDMENLLDALKVRQCQGKQFVPDVRAANPVGFRGLPVLNQAACGSGCQACAEACPTDAIALEPLSLDLGKCVFAMSALAFVRKTLFDSPTAIAWHRRRAKGWLSSLAKHSAR